MDQTEYVDLLGRVAALELLIKNVMVMQALTIAPHDPAAHVEQLKAVIFGSAQNMQRGVGEINDAAWDVAVATMERLLREAADRLRQHRV